MSKVPVSEAAEILGITKEAVYNRIRRGTLKSVEKDGIKYVVLDEPQNEPKPKRANTAKQSKFDVNEFLLSQINELKEQNKSLQDNITQIYREKEQILVENKNEIAQIYREKEAKLRYVLAMLERPLLARQNGEYIAPIDVEFVENDASEPSKWTPLNEFLKTLNLSQKHLKKTQNKIIKNIGKVKFIKFKEGAIMVKSKKIKKMLGAK